MVLGTRIIHHITPEYSLLQVDLPLLKKPENLSSAGFIHTGELPYN